jgi:hypothetical protein
MLTLQESTKIHEFCETPETSLDFGVVSLKMNPESYSKLLLLKKWET